MMTIFIRILAEQDKSEALKLCASKYRSDVNDARIFELDTTVLQNIPGAPFAYWVGDSIRDALKRFPSIGQSKGTACVGLQTSDDFRFIRLWWEAPDIENRWVPHAKGGRYSPYYLDIYLKVNWKDEGRELKAWADPLYGNSGWSRIIKSTDYYFRPGITWTKSTTSVVSFRCMPASTIFGVSGLGFFVDGDSPRNILAFLAVMNSTPFRYLISMSLGLAAEGRKHYESGIVNKNPFPHLNSELVEMFSGYAERLWRLKYRLESTDETSHAFFLPELILSKRGGHDEGKINIEIQNIENEIDKLSFSAYGFREKDITEAKAAFGNQSGSTTDEVDDENLVELPATDAMLAWAGGVAMGRFDWRLAITERQAPYEPAPFDPLPTQSPGMLFKDSEPFHVHDGILVDDPGNPHDFARLIEEVLACVDVTVPDNVRRWLQRDFFPFHLRQYSKSRRRAPIYWPLSTASGSYTLWVYYPTLSSQTLYTAINDFVEPKLTQVGSDVTAHRNRGAARTRDDEKKFEALQAFELELIDLRDTLLKLAPTYKPNHDDGVQISAAPLWPLFRHKPWQKVLKDTWAKLEKGD